MERLQRNLMTSFIFTTLYLVTTEACNASEFQCISGQCIPIALQCEGSSFDCDDRSDEVNCTVGVQPCPEGRHRCDNGECVTNRNECPVQTTLTELSTSIVETSTQNMKETTPTNTFQKQSFTSSKYDIQPTATRSILDSSTPLVKNVTTPADGHDPDSKNNSLYYWLFLLLLIPICGFGCYRWKRQRTKQNEIV
ncbi:low-density lipoprotein receptor-like [Mytilus trossulus]|uniref:low-density lipoprotein receptor-like n=1 Tax=Mytilus trossulus TaxID=6551 RepID=UPI00300427A4